MRVVREVSLTQVLVDWGIGEGLGRSRSRCAPEIISSLQSPYPAEAAITVLFKTRGPLLIPMLHAYPKRFLLLEVTPDDGPRLKILGKPAVALSLAASSPAQRIAQDNAYIEKLTESHTELKGPLLAFARDPAGPFTCFDGIHRAIAWFCHAERWRPYPISMNVIISERPVAGWE